MTEAAVLEGQQHSNLLRRLLGLSPYLFSLLILLGVYVAPAATTGIDETIFYAQADAFRRTGAFIVENGLGDLEHDQLRLYVMVNGPNGLTPQYPVGSAILGGLLMKLFGIKGMILLNGLAVIGAIFVTRALARRLFKDDIVADLSVLFLVVASFFTEFAFAVWPHATNGFCVTAAILFAVKAMNDGEEVRNGLLAGALVGVGLLFRIDTLLIVPGLAMVALLYAREPVRFLFGVGVGTLPGLAIASWANWQKFGTFNPITYGKTGDGFTSLTTYIGPAAFLVALFLALLVWRSAGFPRPRWKVMALVGAIILASAVAVSFSRDLVVAYLEGAWAMVVDIRDIADARPGVERTNEGLIIFWGHIKQALGQSMPWLGSVLLLIGLPLTKDRQRSLGIIALLFFFWTFPLFLISWHGGPGNSVRYLGPMVPMLCSMGAWLAVNIWDRSEKPGLAFGVGVLLGSLILIAIQFLHPGTTAMVRQGGATSALLFLAFASALGATRFGKERVVRQINVAALGLAMLSAYMSTATSLAQDHLSRANNEKYAKNFIDMPGKSLVIGGTAIVREAAFREGIVVTQPAFYSGSDVDMIDDAMGKGYLVYVFPWAITQEIVSGGYDFEPSDYSYGDGLLLRVTRDEIGDRAR